MPGITSNDTHSPLQSVALYVDATLKTYLHAHQNRNDAKFIQLRKMMETGLYLVAHHNEDKEIDLVGFEQEGSPVCFKLRVDTKLFISDFKEITLEHLSQVSQEIVQALQQKLGFPTNKPFNP